MAEGKGHIPASVLWGPGSITVLIVGFVMLIIAGMIHDDNKNKQTATNVFLIFKNAFYQELASGPGTVKDQKIQVIAAYVREHRENLDKIIHQEKTLRDSLDKAQRMMLHIQSPDKLPEGLLLMTNHPHWQKLQESAQDRNLLVEVLHGSAQPPEIKLLDDPFLPQTFIYLWIFIPQFCAFFVYLIALHETREYGHQIYKNYRWYELSWLGKAGIVLLMPGAGILMIPMIIWAGGRRFSMWLRDDRKQRHTRREALKNGSSLDISSDASKALLRKLQQSRGQEQREVRHGELV